jgi:uncharacterized protein YehS (DUF1456 family)
LNNNDVLRRVRYTFDFSDSKMIEIFALADHEVTRAEVSDWLKKEEHPQHMIFKDRELASFLNGLIIDKRGKRDEPLPPEGRLTNNIIMKKLKIALNLQSEDIITMLSLADFRIGKAELSAFFRKPTHKHFRKCQDQVLRNFLHGLQIKIQS